MSSYSRNERAARRHLRELERMEKEQEKLDELAKAKLAVEQHESRIELLLSLHKEVAESRDWSAIAASLPPLRPLASNDFEMKARQDFLILTESDPSELGPILEEAKHRDGATTAAKQNAHELIAGELLKSAALARRILSHDVTAYQTAIQELCPLAELEELGSDMEFTVPSWDFIACELIMKDSTVIPAETKALTATGKLSVKAMPKTRFHEIYQDYICGGVLRVARELFALLPLERILVTAKTAVFDSATGVTAIRPVLSVMMTRAELAQFNWEQVDPSDAIDRMPHRGDFKASRKTGAFLPIIPLEFTESDLISSASSALQGFLDRAKKLRAELAAETSTFTQSKS